MMRVISNFLKKASFSGFLGLLVLLMLFSLSQSTSAQVSTPTPTPVNVDSPESYPTDSTDLDRELTEEDVSETNSRIDSFFDYLDRPMVKIIGWSLGILGWIIGMYSGFIQIKSYGEQRELEGAYQELFDNAQREWQGKYTAEQVTDLTAQLELLRRQVKDDIPILARQVFLRDKRQIVVDQLGDLFNQYNEISDQLTEGNGTDSLAPEIRNAVERSVMPGYLKQKQRQRSTIILLFFVFVLVAFPMLTESINYVIFGAFYSFLWQIASVFNNSAETLLAYIFLLIIAFWAVYSVSDNQLLSLIQQKERRSLIAGVILIILWLLTVIVAIEGSFFYWTRGNAIDLGFGFMSLLFLVFGVRFTHLWLRRC